MYSEEAKDFLVKVLERSGLSAKGTYLPAAIHPQLSPEPKYDMDTAMLEAKMVMTGAVQDLMDKTGEPGLHSKLGSKYTSSLGFRI
jgi:hypothetical protein